MAYSIDKFKALVTEKRGLAAPNLFMVSLPTDFGDFRGEDINIICKSTVLPGRGINTMEKGVGHLSPKIASSQQLSTIDFSFHLTNDYFIRKYFDQWMDLIVKNEPPYAIGYHQDYIRDLEINQIRRGESFPIFNKDLGFDANIPPEIANRLPTIGRSEDYGISGVDLGDLVNGEINIALISPENIVYTAIIERAYPVAVSPINLSDDASGVNEVNVTFEYHNWISKEEKQKRTFADIVGDTIDNVIEAIVGTVGIGD